MIWVEILENDGMKSKLISRVNYGEIRFV